MTTLTSATTPPTKPLPAEPIQDTIHAVPRWARIAAKATTFVVLPSGIWRISMGFGLSMGFPLDSATREDMPGSGTVYVIALSIFAELVALLTLGLVQRWGEVFPGWIPYLRGRRVPMMVAIVPATIGGIILVGLWTPTPLMITGEFGGVAPDGFWWTVAMGVGYLPLMAWGPLVLAVTYAYYRRRRA